MYIYVMRGFYVSMSLLNPSHFLFFAYSLSLYIYSENLYTPSSLKLKQVPACLGLRKEEVRGYLTLKLPLGVTMESPISFLFISLYRLRTGISVFNLLSNAL